MQRVHKVAATLVVLLGVVHIAMAPVFFDEFTERVMWYVAQGLFGIVLGLLNFVSARMAWRDRPTAWMCHISNVLGSIFLVLYLVADRAPPSFVVILLFVVLLASAAESDRRSAGA